MAKQNIDITQSAGENASRMNQNFGELYDGAAALDERVTELEENPQGGVDIEKATAYTGDSELYTNKRGVTPVENFACGEIVTLFNTAVFNDNLAKTKVNTQAHKKTTYSAGAGRVTIASDGYAYCGSTVHTFGGYDSPNAPGNCGWISKVRIPDGFKERLEVVDTFVPFMVNDPVKVNDGNGGYRTLYIVSGTGAGYTQELTKNGRAFLRLTTTCAIGPETIRLKDVLKDEDIAGVQDPNALAYLPSQDRFAVSRQHNNVPFVLKDAQLFALREDSCVIYRDYYLDTHELDENIYCCQLNYYDEVNISKVGSLFSAAASGDTIRIAYTGLSSMPHIKMYTVANNVYTLLAQNVNSKNDSQGYFDYAIDPDKPDYLDSIKANGIVILGDRVTITSITLNGTELLTANDTATGTLHSVPFFQKKIAEMCYAKHWVDPTGAIKRVYTKNSFGNYFWFNFTSTPGKYKNDYVMAVGVSEYLTNGVILKTPDFGSYEYFFYPVYPSGNGNIGMKFEASCLVATSGSTVSVLVYAVRRSSTQMLVACLGIGENFPIGQFVSYTDIEDASSRNEIFTDFRGSKIFVMHSLSGRAETAIEAFESGIYSYGSATRIASGYTMIYPCVAAHKTAKEVDYYLVSWTTSGFTGQCYVAKFAPLRFAANNAIPTLAKMLETFAPEES